MKIIALITAKITCIITRLFNRGGVIPGYIALKLDKNILKKLKYPQIRIAVTGSSGKGSTSTLIAKILRDNNFKVCFNENGSNLMNGFATACIRYANLKGKIKSDIMLIEVDEKYTKQIFPLYKPNFLIVTNITKDQPPRQHNVDITYQEIISTLPKDTTIITMMDDPFLQKFKLETPNNCVFYGLNKTKYSYTKQIFENLTTYYCPKCHNILKYEYYNFENLGHYKCFECDFQWTKPYVLADDLDLEKETITINNYETFIGGDMLFFAYNTISAYTLVSLLGIKDKEIINSINKVNKIHANNKNQTFSCDNKLYKELKVKAEDAPTWNQAVFKISQDSEKKDIIIGLNKISGRYDFEDVSWLYDIEFELLNNKSLNKIYLLGGYTKDFQKRLILGGIAKDKIVLASDLTATRNTIKNNKSTKVYGIINYDYLETFKNAYKEVLK